MINKHDVIYKCCMTGQQTTTLHEIFFGIANRKTSIMYNLQVPLCDDAHKIAHGLNVVTGNEDLIYLKQFTQRQIKNIFCNKIGIDFNAANLAMNLYDKITLDKLSTIAIENIKNYEV